jgi:Protein of unknown function (DUF3017)
VRNAEDTPASGFVRAADAPGDSGTPRPGSPLPRRRPGENRPDWTAPGEAQALADAGALPYAARADGAPWGPAPEPPPPAAPGYGEARPRRRGSGAAPVRSEESAPRRRGSGPAAVRSGEPGPRSPGPGPVSARPGGPRRPGPRPPATVPGRAASRAAGPSAAAALAQVPYLVALACTLGGIVWAWSGSHAVGDGAGVVGGGLLAAAIARLVLPQSAVGLLASRRRFADVLVLGLLGAGLLVLALVLPPT